MKNNNIKYDPESRYLVVARKLHPVFSFLTSASVKYGVDANIFTCIDERESLTQGIQC